MKVWLPAIRSGTGADVFTLRLQAALEKQGVQAAITWFPLWCELFPERLRWAPIPPGTDLIHVNGWVGGSFVGRGVPVVVTVHHLVHDPAYAPFRSPAQALYHRWHLRSRDLRAILGAQAVTAVSRYVAQTVESFSGRRPVHVIHNWVDVDKYSPAAEPRPPGPFRLLMVGNRSRRKGVDLLPQLAAALGDGFEIFCTGGLRDGGAADMPHVHWFGTLSEEELIRRYQECDAVLSLSRYEGFGYAALEGMACGKPVVGFATSGLSEVAVPACARLVPVGDIVALSGAIFSLRDNPALYADLANNARRRALDAFSGARSIRAFTALYEKAISGSLQQQRTR